MHRTFIAILFFSFVNFTASAGSLSSKVDYVSAQNKGRGGGGGGQMQGMRGKSCFDICMMRVGVGRGLNNCQARCQANREMRGAGRRKG
jgi:hypothetical protein